MDFKEQLLTALKDEEVRNQLWLTINSLPEQYQDKSMDDHLDNESDKNQIYQSFEEMQAELKAHDEQVQQLKSENQQLNQLIEKIKHLLGLSRASDSNLLETISQLRKQLQDKDIQLTELGNIHDEHQATVKQLQQESQEREKKLAFYQTHFADDLRLSSLYQDLSEQTRTSLSGIFKDTSVQGLVACGIQEKNISNLWDYAKNEVVNGINPDIEKISALFELLFNRFILAYPMFALQAVKQGDNFDTHLHIKHNTSSNSSGSITKVLLTGYVNTKTEKVIKPSVVVI
ncbi:hypothetical protein P0F20_002406 [Vibrio metschnikovii]|uniref:hypothetical protein n=1 Tax=Vibrio sp. A11 TaxID=2591464 RepID=UPI001483AF61|nr:hypothetical protein [Vibrio sp. A11]EKO3578281.1 hypothetical protein [Vibrio metschnikovii]EKO3685707.1 hypothetical protein [Vibrio metschnikovii]EKO3689088.1 hypothetical protein [Vibrio metschnikovii]EKO3773854.1 hypothetical protein [Vibrio metschnikovii]EKO3892119.1 hypothetical protein [Vibrio metschnikovii]